MKPVRFLGDSRKVLREFPKDARQEAGYQLQRIQTGLPAEDFKPMHPIGAGVRNPHLGRLWRASSSVYGSVSRGRVCDSCFPEEDEGHFAARC
jgi:phage-related protein